MSNGNQTASRLCRFLNENYFQQLYDAFIEAFSDYVVPFALTETQFRNHIILTAVDLERTVGCLDDDKVVGFSLNGFGEWEGKPTVYDAGTGVIPDHRRQGVSEAMFDLMLPIFKENGAEQCLLEVVTTNTAAIRLYEKLGFYVVRELALLQCDAMIGASDEAPQNIEIREIDDPDWPLLTTFWDGKPSWQNSVEAVKRSRKMKQDTRCVFRWEMCRLYSVFSKIWPGRSVWRGQSSPDARRRYGPLLRALQAEVAEGFSMQVINLDKSLTGAMKFFFNRGFYSIGENRRKSSVFQYDTWRVRSFAGTGLYSLRSPSQPVARRRHSVPGPAKTFRRRYADPPAGAFLTGLATADWPPLRCGTDALFCLGAKGSALARARVKSRKIRDRPGRSPRPSARTSKPDSCHHRNPLVQAG